MKKDVFLMMMGCGDSPLPFPKALQVLRHLSRERKVARIKALDLIDAGAGVLGEVEDVDLTVA
jgi:hypothetical protein